MSSNRRNFIKHSLLAAAAVQLGTISSATTAAPMKKYRKIATEEGFRVPALAEAQQKFYSSPLSKQNGFSAMGHYYGIYRVQKDWDGKAKNLGEQRIEVMDKYGIDMHLLQLSGSWIQLIDAKAGTAAAKIANNYLADAVAKYPTRFAGLTALAPQDPQEAVKEIERGINLGLCGALLQSNVQGQYLDNEKFLPVFEAAEALEVPIYLHPSFPSPGMVDPMIEYGLMGPMFGFSTEAALNTLRLILSGLFDRHPGLTIVLGHLGEGIPYFLNRIDTHYAKTIERQTYQLKHKPSDYFRKHFYVTSSGMNFEDEVMFCHQVLGADKVLYAIDYPYEEMDTNTDVLNNIPLPETDKELFFHGNAERVFNIGNSAS